MVFAETLWNIPIVNNKNSVCVCVRERSGAEKNTANVNIKVSFILGYSSLLTKTKAFILMLPLNSNSIEVDQIFHNCVRAIKQPCTKAGLKPLQQFNVSELILKESPETETLKHQCGEERGST